jgi:hypothetical protein
MLSEVDSLTAVLKTVFSQAINMQLETTIPPTCCAAGLGRVRQYSNVSHLQDPALAFLINSPSLAPHPAAITAPVESLAVFPRESTGSALNPIAPPLQSLARGTGLFYQRALPRNYGVLYLDTDLNQDGQVSPLLGSPDHVFRHIVDLQLTDFELVNDPNPDSALNGLNLVSAFSIRVVMRFFLDENVNIENARWCPSELRDRPGCATSERYWDLVRDFRVILRNSVRNRSLSGYYDARLYENTYFFTPLTLKQ